MPSMCVEIQLKLGFNSKYMGFIFVVYWCKCIFNCATYLEDKSLTCIQALADVLKVKCVVKFIGWASNQVIRVVSHQFRHPGNKFGWKTKHCYNVVCFFKFSFCPQNLLQICYLPSQCVKHRSMLWRVRKVQVSRGNSTLDGWGMGSHNRIITLAADGELGLPPNGHMWPVQWRTWRTRSQICVRFLYGWILL